MKLYKLFILTVVTIGYHCAMAQDSLKYSPADLVNALHSVFGEHHARAVHAKGIFFEGMFVPSAEASAITTAKHLQKTDSKLIVRFSDFTGIPDIPDNAGPANPRGMAIKFILPDGSTTDIVSHSFDGFPTANSDDFRDLLLSIARSGPDAAKPTALDTFLSGHPVAKAFLTSQKLPSSYATIRYFGVNSFKFTNKAGKSIFIRYQFVPEQEKLLTADEYKNKEKDYLIDEIQERIKTGPVIFKMYAQVAAANDAVDNPSIAWPAGRKRIFLGTIRITKLADNSIAADKALSFIPNNVPAGITPEDPMINFRSKAYPISIKERQ